MDKWNHMIIWNQNELCNSTTYMVTTYITVNIWTVMMMIMKITIMMIIIICVYINIHMYIYRGNATMLSVVFPYIH